MANDVIHVQLHAVFGQGMVAHQVFSTGVAPLQVWQQGRIRRFGARIPALQLATKAGTGAGVALSLPDRLA